MTCYLWNSGSMTKSKCEDGIKNLNTEMTEPKKYKSKQISLKTWMK